MPCRCAERRTAIGTAARSALRGDTTALRPAAAYIGRTTVEDVEAMVRRMTTSLHHRLRKTPARR